MQKDTRHLTVTRDHLRSAYDEITLAQGQAEQSIAEAAAARALDHLNLVTRRLETERSRAGRDAAGQAVERAYAASRLAWQGIHDMLNRWDRTAARKVDAVREDIVEAMGALEQACEQAGVEQAWHA